MEDYHQKRELGRVLVWDVVGLAGLGVSVDHMEYWCGIHVDVDEPLYPLE